MGFRLVALDEGPDIPVDRAMVVVGRHPQCDARIDSIRVSRRHCCMTTDDTEVVVRDLGSTNGIRINGQRVEMGRLKAGDELSIAHIRYRLDNGVNHAEKTIADPSPSLLMRPAPASSPLLAELHPLPAEPLARPSNIEQRLASAVRQVLPSALGDRCRIQVIVEVQPETAEDDDAVPPIEVKECRPDSSL